MKKTLIIGDVHGKWNDYISLIEHYKPDRSIQIGDFGWGFPGQKDREIEFQEKIKKLPGNHYFFRGNHDNPAACDSCENCLRDTFYEPETGLMVVAGADSIDKETRLEGFNWWPDEELSYLELDRTIDLYSERKPRIMLSHDGPESAISAMFPWYRKDYPSRTRAALEAMFKIHQPDLWIFGHWHSSRVHYSGKTKFICLSELEGLVIDM